MSLITIHPYHLYLSDESPSNFSINKLNPLIYSLLSCEECPEAGSFSKSSSCPVLQTPIHFLLFSVLASPAKEGLFLMAYILQLANNAH